jgi:hypothetical protein
MTAKKLSWSKRMLFTEYCGGDQSSSAPVVVSKDLWLDIMERLDSQERTLMGQINWFKRDGNHHEKVLAKAKELRGLRNIKEQLSLEIEEI